MGIFNKDKSENLMNEKIKNPYSDWNEQARVARNPSMLTPEELLGFNAEEDKESNQEVNNFDTSDSNMKKLYERMLGNLKEDKKESEPEQISLFDDYDSENEQSVEDIEEQEETVEPTEAVVFEEEPIIEEVAAESEIEEIIEEAEPEKAIEEKPAPKEDAFKDFFLMLDDEISSNKNSSKESVAVIEKEEPAPIEEVAVETDSDEEREKIDALLKAVYASHEEEKEEQNQESAEEIVKTFEEKVASKTPAPAVEETVVFDSVAEIEKTQVVDSQKVIAAAETHLHVTPRHSLYASEKSSIDKKAIDDFFNNSFEEIEDLPTKKHEHKHQKHTKDVFESEKAFFEEISEEAITDVFNDAVEDYENLDSAAEIKEQIIARGKRISSRLFATLILTVFMLFVNGLFFSSQGMDLGIIPNILNLVLLAVTAIINYRSFLGLFSKDHDTDCCSGTVLTAILIQSLVSVIFFQGAGGGLGAFAGLSLLISLIAKRAVNKATLTSIGVIATNEQKCAVLPIEDSALADDLTGGDSEGEPFVCYGKKTVNVHGFLKNWYRPTPTDRRALTASVISLVVAMISAFVTYYIIESNIETALSVFSIALSLCCAPSYFLINSVPLKVMADGLKIYDSTVAGFNGADVLSNCSAVVVNASDLFPAGSIILHNMMPLSANSVDKSIAKAAAVSIAAESPLANIFKDIVRDSVSSLPKAEDVKYENKLGISGWIDNERILIGNRTLMENHNVKTPSTEFDRKIMAAGYKPVYLACGGKPCLLFVVQYSAVSDVKFEVERLCNTGTSLIINSTDPNITKQFICEAFELADNDVFVMSRSNTQKVEKLTKFQEDSNGFAAYKPKSSGLLAAVSSSIRLRTINLMMTALHIIGVIAGVVLLALWIYSKGFTLFTPLLALALEVVFICVVTAVPYIKKP